MKISDQTRLTWQRPTLRILKYWATLHYYCQVSRKLYYSTTRWSKTPCILHLLSPYMANIIYITSSFKKSSCWCDMYAMTEMPGSINVVEKKKKVLRLLSSLKIFFQQAVLSEYSANMRYYNCQPSWHTAHAKHLLVPKTWTILNFLLI